MLGLELSKLYHKTDTISSVNWVHISFQVSGPYLTQYEVYYKRLDPEAKGEIGAMDAAKFLKNSGLADEFLGKVRKNSKGIRFVVLRLIQRLFELDH